MHKGSISLIIPIFNEENNIVPLYKEAKFILDKLNEDYEIIFVNDGSADNGLEILRGLAKEDNLLKVISFPKNFGQTAASACGVDNASGEIIIFMDGDLQNDPNDIPLLLLKIKEGYDVVSGWRRSRKDPFLTRYLPSFFANKLISFLSGVKLHDFGCTLKAYKLNIIKDIRLYGEMHRFIPIFASWVGAKIIEIPINHRHRIHGKSKYNIWRALKVILDLITIKFLGSFKTKPIYIYGAIGITSIFFGFVCFMISLYNKLFNRISPLHNSLLLYFPLFVIIGMQSILMGLLAEMQMRIYFESLHKSIYYIKEKINL